MKHKEAENFFHLKGGGAVKTLGELMEVLKDMPEEEFNHHVNSETNDFARWTGNSLHNQDMANKIGSAKTKEALLMLLEHELDEKRPEPSPEPEPKMHEAEAPEQIPELSKQEEPKHETHKPAEHVAVHPHISSPHGKFVLKEFIY